MGTVGLKKYGFLFGAGAEIGYGLPSGGEFALGVFQEDTKKIKEELTCRVSQVKYRETWFNGCNCKNVSTFGKSTFKSIIKSTLEHRRKDIEKQIGNFDELSEKVIGDMDVNFDDALYKIVGVRLENIETLDVEYANVLNNESRIFQSKYFSALFRVYLKNQDSKSNENLETILKSMIQLQLGALGEELVQNMNSSPFAKNNNSRSSNDANALDNLLSGSEIFKLDYNQIGVDGLEFLMNMQSLNEYELDSASSIIICFAYRLLKEIYSSVLDYKSVIDEYWHYLYEPSSNWIKFCKISAFLWTVYQYITEKESKAVEKKDGYYNLLQDAINRSFLVSGVATTNYTSLIDNVLGDSLIEEGIIHLNGSVKDFYDPYFNKILKEEDKDNYQEHFVVPLLFSQSGTKPMTTISMAEKYVKLYNLWKDATAIVVVGYSFGEDDEHVNGILRTLVNEDGRSLIVVTLRKDSDNETPDKIASKLRVPNDNKIKVILVDNDGKIDGDRYWTEALNAVVESI